MELIHSVFQKYQKEKELSPRTFQPWLISPCKEFIVRSPKASGQSSYIIQTGAILTWGFVLWAKLRCI